MTPRARWCLAAGLLVGCEPYAEMSSVAGSTGTTTSAGTRASDSGSGSGSSSTGSSTSSASNTTDPSAPGDDTMFIIAPDLAAASRACDVWAQDCPTGEKCMPHGANGGSSWELTRCSPLADMPNAVGEPCSVVGSDNSGLDDCALGSMCRNLDPDTNMGECVAFCHGSEAQPLCEDPCTHCNIFAEGTLILCLPECDPVAQNCSEGQGCYPSYGNFACAPDASGTEGAIGDPCEFLNVCDAGNFCADAEIVPACEGSGCCAPFCDPAGPDPCPGLLFATTCVPWYAPGQDPGLCSNQSAIGACVLLP